MDNPHFAAQFKAIRSLADWRSENGFIDGSRMSREVHVRFCESVGVRFPRATHLIVGFEYGPDAEWFHRELPKRLAKFGLSLAADKSGILRFSRCDMKGSKCFTFLGFEFYWANTRRGKKTVKRRTSKKKFKASLLNLKEWLKKNRSLPLKELAETLRKKYRGYFNYYGVIGNSHQLWRYWRESRRIIFRRLNRRSQRKSYTWEGFEQMWATLQIPRPKVIEPPYQQQPQKKLSYR